jgi:hypothetical protein
MVRTQAAARGKIRALYCGGMPGLPTNGLSKKSGGLQPEDDEHLKRIKAISRENTRLANETPMTQEQAEEISKRSTRGRGRMATGRSA